MQKNLNNLLVIAKIAKIISKIVYVFTIIGTILCASSIVSLFVLDNVVNIAGINFQSMVEINVNASKQEIISSIITATIACISMCYLAKMSCTYYEYVVNQETPFTQKSANDIRRLGIYTIVVPLVTYIINVVVWTLLGLILGFKGELEFNLEVNFTLGLIYIILAQFIEYTVKLENEK